MTAAPAPLVCIVDDDASVRRSLARLVRSAGYDVEAFASAQEFLVRPQPDGPCCLVLDLRMPGLGGLELQDLLAAAGTRVGIVFLTGHGDIRASVKAMRGGAIDFLTKPTNDLELLGAIERALAWARQAGRAHVQATEVHDLIKALTPREVEVFALVVTGMLNKQIASELGISEKTVKVHRGRVMEKTRARSVAELVRLADRAGVIPGAGRTGPPDHDRGRLPG